MNLISQLFLSGVLVSLVQFDMVLLILLVVVVLGVLVWFKDSGWPTAILRTLQTTAITLIPLPLEIYLFDSASTGMQYSAHQFNLQVTAAQAVYGFLPWFTNAALLYSASALLIATTASLIILRRRLRAVPRTTAF